MSSFINKKITINATKKKERKKKTFRDVSDINFTFIIYIYLRMWVCVCVCVCAFIFVERKKEFLETLKISNQKSDTDMRKKSHRKKKYIFFVAIKVVHHLSCCSRVGRIVAIGVRQKGNNWQNDVRNWKSWTILSIRVSTRRRNLQYRDTNFTIAVDIRMVNFSQEFDTWGLHWVVGRKFHQDAIDFLCVVIITIILREGWRKCGESVEYMIYSLPLSKIVPHGPTRYNIHSNKFSSFKSVYFLFCFVCCLLWMFYISKTKKSRTMTFFYKGLIKV